MKKILAGVVLALLATGALAQWPSFSCRIPSSGGGGGGGGAVTRDAVAAVGGIVGTQMTAVSDLAAGDDAADGSLPNGTYYLVVVAVDNSGYETAMSNEVSVTATGGISDFPLSGTPVVGAVSYRIYYGATPGGQTHYVPDNGYPLPSAYFYDLSGAVAGTPSAVSKANYLNLLLGAVTPNSNVWYGTNLSALTSGYKNTAVGVQTLEAVTEGFNNTGVGEQTLISLTTGTHNSALGSGALEYLVDGNTNTAVGYVALGLRTSGDNNTAVGYGALWSSTGDNNSALGYNASNVQSGLSNTLSLGAGVQTTASNRAVIGNADVTDVYLGSESAAATVHAANFIVGSTSIKPIRCVSGSASGALTLGVSNKVTATCTGATNGMAAACSPTTYPGDGVIWNCYVSASNTVTVVETGLGVVTPTATTYQVSVTP